MGIVETCDYCNGDGIVEVGTDDNHGDSMHHNGKLCKKCNVYHDDSVKMKKIGKFYYCEESLKK